MWLNNFKIAIIEKNTKNINKLLDEMPKFKDIGEIEEVMYLMREASELLHALKNETVTTMSQLKKNIEFLNSTQHEGTNSLDIKL